MSDERPGTAPARGIPSRRAQRIVGGLGLALACLLLVLTGFAGVGRPPGARFGEQDFVYLYAGGHTWLTGANPWDRAAFAASAEVAFRDSPMAAAELSSAFAYPPTASVPFAALAALPPGPARLAFAALNLLSIAALVATCLWALRPELRAAEFGPLATGAIATLGVGSHFASDNVWMGQSSLLVVALLCGAFAAQARGRPIAAGALAAFATIKPSIGIFHFAALALGRRWRALAALALGAALLASLAVWQAGPWGALRGWIGALAEYRGASQNVPGFRHSFGVRSLLDALGVAVPSLAAVGALGFGLLWSARTWLRPFELFAASLALSLLFVHAHDYDLVAAIPLFAALLARHAGSLPAFAAAAAAIALVHVPLRFVARLELPWIERWREAALLAMLVWLVAAAVRQRRPRDRVAAGPALPR